jgi:hypothetical protein
MTARKVIAVSVCGTCLILGATSRVQAQSQDPIAVITELRLNRGDVKIRLPGKTVTERPGVLQSLVPNTVVLVSKDASATILFTDGSKTTKVEAKNSPFEVKPSKATPAQGRSPVAQLAVLLLGKKPPTYVALATRGDKKVPRLLSPRSTKLMTPMPVLQWMGMDQQVGTVHVDGPDGVLWTADNVAVTQIKYPPTAPPLKPGVEYSWSLEKKGFPPEKTTFKVMGPDESKSIREKLSSLKQNTLISPVTSAVLKAGLLMSNEFFYDARELLLDSLKADPEEPTLHFLLGEVYEKTGLQDLAAEEYDDADFLGKGPFQ